MLIRGAIRLPQRGQSQRWMMMAILWVAPLYAESESWVRVVGGAFVVQAKELERMHASLELTVTEAAKAQKKTLFLEPIPDSVL